MVEYHQVGQYHQPGSFLMGPTNWGVRNSPPPPPKGGYPGGGGRSSMNRSPPPWGGTLTLKRNLPPPFPAIPPNISPGLGFQHVCFEVAYCACALKHLLEYSARKQRPGLHRGAKYLDAAPRAQEITRQFFLETAFRGTMGQPSKMASIERHILRSVFDFTENSIW